MAILGAAEIAQIVRAQAANNARYQRDKDGKLSFSQYVLTHADDKMIAMYSDKAVAAIKAHIYPAVTIERARRAYNIAYSKRLARRRYDDDVLQSTILQYISNYVLACFAEAQQNAAAYQYYTGLSNEEKVEVYTQIFRKKEVDDDTD